MFEYNEKNRTLFNVIIENLKVLERKLIPLLEMFNVENAYFKEVQKNCMKIISDKKQLKEGNCFIGIFN